MKRAGGVWGLALVLGWIVAGTAWADYPRQPQNPDPNRPGRLVSHPPWASDAPAPKARSAVGDAATQRTEPTHAPVKKRPATKAKLHSERGKATLALPPRSRPVRVIDVPGPRETFDAVKAGVLGLASAAGLAVIVMTLVVLLRRRAPA